MRIKTIIIVLIILFICGGCVQGKSVDQLRNPDFNGCIISKIDKKNKVIIVWKKNIKKGYISYTIPPFKITPDTQIVEKDTEKHINLKDVEIGDKVDIWYYQKGKSWIANHMVISKVLRSEVISEMLPREKGKFNVHVFRKSDRKPSRAYKTFIKEIDKYQNYSQHIHLYLEKEFLMRKLDIKELPAILVIDNNNIVLQTHDYKEVLDFAINHTKSNKSFN